ncbi:MAG: hypothetical protein ACKOC5_01615 [Chloroflexota bacterium]
MSRRSTMHLLTRLAVGGVLTGYDGLRSRLETWEQQRSEPAAGSSAAGPQIIDTTFHLPPGESPGEPSQVEPLDPVTASERERLRYALIGAVFAAEQRAGRSLRLAGRAAQAGANLVELVAGPVYASRALSPLRRGVEALAQRGEQVVDGWIEQGRYEDQAGRQLAQLALSEQVDTAISYLTENEEVQELVQSQGVGLVDEVVEEARERTMSADNFLEAIVRSVLRRPMRWELPEPPESIKEHAIRTRQWQGRVIKR